MAYGTVNADLISTSTTGGVLGAGNATGFKNRIINGAMMIDQRNAGASVSTSSGTYIYTLDRWQAIYAQTSKYTVQQNAGSVTPPAGFVNYLGVTSTSSYTAGSSDYFSVRQIIEGLNIADLGWGTANAKTVTLSFQVYSSLTGTFGGCLTNSAENRSYPFSYTVSSANTWTTISVTISGDTSGTWLTTNGQGIQVRFGLGAGSTYLGTSGAWAAGNYIQPTGTVSVVGTNGATWYITGVQLEVGASASSFEVLDYGRQLIQCQRYCMRWDSTAFDLPWCNSTNYNTTLAYGILPFPTKMRTAPTFTFKATSTLRLISSGGAFTASNSAADGITTMAAEIYGTYSGLTQGYSSWMRAGSANDWIQASAEL